MRKGYLAAISVGVAIIINPAFAQETTTYTYDSLGRVTGVSHSGTANNGIAATYSYDPAGNRTNVTVTGASGTGGGSDGDPGAGASAPQHATMVVVVPLNGFTIIPIN